MFGFAEHPLGFVLRRQLGTSRAAFEGPAEESWDEIRVRHFDVRTGE